MRSYVRGLSALSLVVLAGLVVAPGPSVAGGSAPQALALVSSERPIAVSCDQGGCRVQLSSFCLERDRDAPETGAAYELAAGKLALVVQGRAGVRRLPLPADAVFTADRGHRSVTLRLPPDASARWPGAQLALEVGPMTTLLPVPDGTWSDRHDDEQKAAVVGPLRAVGERTVEGADGKVAVVRLLNQAVNRLPVVVSRRAEEGEAAWRQVLAGAPDGPGKRLAAETFEACQKSTQQGLFYNIRNCFILRHDRLMDGLNQAYWNAVAGS